MNSNFQQSWSPSAVFSPSAARQQLLEAKDWSYIDQWLTAHFHPRPVPPFERNSDTLKALLALSSANETANEEVSLKRQIEAKALKELKDQHDALHSAPPTPLTHLTDSLPPDGRLALHSLSLLTVALSLPPSSPPTQLATAITHLTLSETSLAQQHLDLDSLHRRLQTQLGLARAHLVSLSALPPDPSTFSPLNLTTLNQKLNEWTHTSRHLAQKSSEYSSRLTSLLKKVPTEQQLDIISIPALEQAEKNIAELKDHVLALESQVKAFQGLPPDKDIARLEVERMEGEWRDLDARKEREYDRLAS